MKMTGESLDELVFENRNKAYGAYVIRKEYAESLKIGLFVTSGFVGLIVLCSFVMKTEKIIEKITDVPKTDTTIVDIQPPIIDPPPPPVVKPPSGPKIASFNPIASDEHVDTTQTILPADIPAPIDPGPETVQTGPPTDGGTEGGVAEVPPVVDPLILVPDQVPEMEGGVAKFLRKNLTYPETAIAKKTTGTVYISFVVEKDGSIGNITVLKGIGDGCEEEATRVVKKMKWKPGKNHGIPVRVPFTLPVKFTINE
jgi:protein TonB